MWLLSVSSCVNYESPDLSCSTCQKHQKAAQAQRTGDPCPLPQLCQIKGVSRFFNFPPKCFRLILKTSNGIKYGHLFIRTPDSNHLLDALYCITT